MNNALPLADLLVPGQPTETIIVAQPFQLRLDDNRLISVPVGVQEAPAGFAEHFYAKAHGVMVYARSEPPAPEAPKPRRGRPPKADGDDTQPE